MRPAAWRRELEKRAAPRPPSSARVGKYVAERMVRVHPIVAAVAVALSLGGCLHAAEQRRPGAHPRAERARSGAVAVVERPQGTDAAYVAGDLAHGLPASSGPERLAAGVNSTFITTLSPAAVLDPASRRLLAYNSWSGKGPVLRLRDLRTDADTVLERGALSIAWRSDGALAYFKGRRTAVDLRRRERPRGHVVVRRSRQARPRRWTSQAGDYVVAAWARKRLLAYRIAKGKRWPDLLALAGAGRARVLAQRSSLVALSPDGRRAFVAAYGSSRPLVRVLDSAGGEELARFRFGRGGAAPRGEPVRWVLESGSWEGDIVVAAASPGLLVFRVGPTDVTLEQILRFPGGSFPLGVFEPRVDRSGRRIVASAQLAERPRQAVPDTAALECDRLARRCVQGPPVSAGQGLRLVYNPSRP